MKRTYLFLSSCLLLLAPALFKAQNQETCIRELMSYESMARPGSDSLENTKNTYSSYTLRATGWDNETTVSHIKLYKMGEHMDFFSEQANIYMDDEEALIVMPEQKVM